MPDARGGYGSDKHTKIIVACEKFFEANKNNCSGFVSSVVNDIAGKLLLSGQANDIYDQIQQAPWVSIGKGIEAQNIAGLKALEGNLVVAATKGTTHGHVAIIIDSNTFVFKKTSSKAIGYWGSLGGTGHRYMPVSFSWAPSKFCNIIFAYCQFA